MKQLIALLACWLLASHLLAADPLTDAEKKRLADVELAAKRTPAMREAAKTYSEARKAYTEDRRKFPADRDQSAGKVYREATAVYEAALKKAVLDIDPTIEPLWTRQAELKKLGLDKASEGETVADSDSPRNEAMKAPQDIAGLPRVLLIGDSISIGYTLPVRELLKGKANVHRIPQNGGATDVGLEKMKGWLGDGKWDVIHFNFGLHDAKYLSETTQRASREQYTANLRTLIAQMKATGAKLVFATTTPVPKGGILSPTRKFDNIEDRNRIAVAIMQDQGVAIDDLYAIALPAMAKVGRENDVHFSPEGYELLAKAVAQSIEAALHAAPSANPRIIIASEAGAKLDSDVTKGGGTDDTALIQRILDRAPKLGSLKLVVDGPILVRGLKVHSNTTIECLNRDCGFYLADNSNRPLIANATPQPEGRADRNLSFLGGTYNGNAEHQEQKFHPDYGWLTAFALHGVEQVLMRDVSITNSRTFFVYLTNWRRIVFENIYINLDDSLKPSNQDGIHVQGPGEFLSIRNLQGRSFDDMVALNIDDLKGDWNSEGQFLRATKGNFGKYAGIGPVSDVDIDGVQADDCAQVIRILSRASRLDRVSIRNVKGTYRDFGVWITPYFREGGNIGRLEFENIDLRPVAPRAYNYVPPFLFWIAGKMEQVTLKNISSHAPIDDRPLVWIQPDAKIDRLCIDGLNVYDPRKEIGHTPLIRADGRIALLQVRDVVVQRLQATAPAGSLISTSMDRTALKAFMDARAGIVNPKGMRGWPEGPGYLTSQPQIQRLQIDKVVAEGLEQVLDHQAGTIETLDLRDVSVPATTTPVHQGGDAKITR